MKEIIISLFHSQVFQTVISGTLVFCLSQIIQKFILEPIWEYKKIIGKIDNRLKYYSNKMSSILPKNVLLETSEKIRDLSCDLDSSYKQIPFNSLLVRIRCIPSRENISKASDGLIFIANAAGRKDFEVKIFDEIKSVRKLLRIEEL